MKKTTKKSHSQSPILLTLPPVGGAQPLPAEGAPTPPADTGPEPVNSGRHQRKPFGAHLDVALDAAAELRGGTALAAFVSALIDPTELANGIEFAARWSRERAASKAWQSYANKQSKLAWDYMLGILANVADACTGAFAANPTLAQQAPAFARFIGVRSETGARAHRNRVARARAEGKPLPEKAQRRKTQPVETPGASKPAVTNGAGASAIVTNAPPVKA